MPDRPRSTVKDWLILAGVICEAVVIAIPFGVVFVWYPIHVITSAP